MAPVHGRKARRTGRHDPRHRKKTYEPARLQDSAEEFEPQVDGIGIDDDDNAQDSPEDISSEEDEAPTRKNDAYAALLESFGTVAQDNEPRRKKRKIDGGEVEKSKKGLGNAKSAHSTVKDQTLAEDLREGGEAEDEVEVAADEDELPSDAFNLHFADPDENELARKLKLVAEHQWNTKAYKQQAGGTWTMAKLGDASVENARLPNHISDVRNFVVKKRFEEPLEEIVAEQDDVERAYATAALGYKDILFGGRTVANSPKLRSMTCLHALNHIFKTRDRVLKNNERISKAGENLDHEYRDQGFTRPKVVVLLPTRQSCVRWIESMVDIFKPEQQENRKRFEESYVADEDMAMDRPDDYKELFAGNNDDLFRIGVKFTRKTIKFFSQFYNSDLILASPLGLRSAIGGKKADSDFLSSIEVLIMDQTDALLMQNWDHVIHVLEHLNLQPKEAHGCDFSRVRMWYLEGHARHLRQTIILSSHVHPQQQALFASHCVNIAGKAIYQPSYAGAILTPQSMGVKQTFQRFPSPTLPNDPTARFTHFTTAILPSIAKTPRNPDGSGLGLLIYIPDSLDFPKVRNHFSFHPTCAHISFGSVDENHEPGSKDVRRARSHFETGRHSVILYTERAHHFFRYKIRGVKQVLFYGVPTKPVFWEEIVGLIDEEGGVGAGAVRCLFSKWERLALERVVGSERYAKMVKEKGGDTFEFV